MYAIPRRKQNGGRSGKEGRPISLLGSALIFKKNARVYSCSENERISFMLLQGMEVMRFPFVPLKNTHTIHAVQQGVLLNISLPMK